MKITDLLSKQTVSINIHAESKEDLLKQAVQLMAKSGAISDIETYEKGVFAREQESTTGIGEGIAIPHCKSPVVKKPALAAMVIPGGAPFDSLDGEPVELLFLIAAPNSEDNVHLDVLARLSEMLLDEEFKNNLLKAKNADEFLKIIDKAEQGKLEEKEEHVELPEILAVTACPTGIAHTYMAEQALKDAAKAMGISIKVETNGSGGVKNLLTDEEIEHAKGIVVAADTNVEVARFAGKRVIQVAVAKGIHEPEKLIKQALDENTPIFKAGEERKQSDSQGKESVGHKIYKHLMNGVSHMLPFVIGGGILIALAFLIDTIAGNSGYIPTGPDDPLSFGTVNVIARWFKTVGGYAFNFMVWILAGFIAMSIAGRPGLAIGMVGGMMATVTFNIANVDASSGFLGGIAAGFMGGYLVILLGKLFKKMPKSLESLKPTLIYPILGILGIGLLMWLVNTPLAYLNIGFSNALEWMASNNLLILLCALLGGMMAIDMGGPINKAAYVFGTAMLAQSTAAGYTIMAAVMAGGMVPPLGIALAATLFPAKFSKDERKQAMVNYVMGASFITEGAIPFAAADPIRVIGSCVAGSAIAGLFTGLFGCTLMAPHGGIFVVATIGPDFGRILLYLLAIIIGSAVTGLLLGLLKKNHENPELGKWKGIQLFKK